MQRQISSESSIVRHPASPQEFDQIYMMGYDAWGDAAPVDAYLESCRASRKYLGGTWYVLAEAGQIRSSLIVYAGIFDIPQGYCGIGSIATLPQYRKKGYASQLINAVCARLSQDGIQGVYLHSDIATSFYERLDFKRTPQSTASCMIRLLDPTCPVPEQVPVYF